MGKIPKALSVGEELFAMHCKSYGFEPVREYKFMPNRKFRFDFCFPEKKVAVEIDGGTWNGGRHSRGAGYAADCEKMNFAALFHWRVFRFTPEMVKSGAAIDMVALVLM